MNREAGVCSDGQRLMYRRVYPRPFASSTMCIVLQRWRSRICQWRHAKPIVPRSGLDGTERRGKEATTVWRENVEDGARSQTNDITVLCYVYIIFLWQISRRSIFPFDWDSTSLPADPIDKSVGIAERTCPVIRVTRDNSVPCVKAAEEINFQTVVIVPVPAAAPAALLIVFTRRTTTSNRQDGGGKVRRKLFHKLCTLFANLIYCAGPAHRTLYSVQFPYRDVKERLSGCLRNASSSETTKPEQCLRERRSGSEVGGQRGIVCWKPKQKNNIIVIIYIFSSFFFSFPIPLYRKMRTIEILTTPKEFLCQKCDF